MTPAAADLQALDAAMTRAFATGDTSSLDVLGYGEITTVVVCTIGGERHACKRLPPFATRREADRYAALFEEYLETLSRCGVRVVSSSLQSVAGEGGTTVLYCVQPVLPADRLAVRVLARSDDARAVELFECVLGRILAAVSPRVGLDGQLSNWMMDGDEPLFLDVTTPMLKDEAGRDRLDIGLFLASVPPPVRPLFRRFVVPAVVDKYHEPRGVVLDLVANLIKEGQESRIGAFLRVANARLSPRLDEAEVRRYYQSDARVWTAWQLMRRADRFVRRRLLGRPYPFLLPGRIERRGPPGRG